MGSFVNGIFVPDPGETGWANQVSNNMRRLSEVSVNVKAFGALADGSTDDSTAIAAAITAAPEGGTVFFPAGHYVISTLTITKHVTLAGTGYWNGVNAAFANAGWGSGNYGTNFGGTVIRSTATSNRAILASTAGKGINVRDLMLLGPGSGTSNGFELGTAANLESSMDWSNVLAANFGGAGYRFLFTLSNAFTNLQSRGCKTGFSLSDACNDNQFYRTEVQFSDTDGIYITTSSGCHFYGGLLQNISGTAAIRCNTSSQQHVFDGFWFESVTATNAVKFGPTGMHGCSLWNTQFSANGGTIDIDGNLCVIGRCRSTGSPGGNITIAGGAFNQLFALDGVTVTDSGVQTQIVNFNGTSSFPTLKTPAIATGSLPAAGAAENGRIIIEDAGAGNRNLIIYAGGERFRIDGGPNV